MTAPESAASASEPEPGVSPDEASRSAAQSTAMDLGGVPIEILLVEDNPGDVRLTREGLREGRLRNNLHVATDGEQALEILQQDAGAEDVPQPDLILLDLNLPKIDGHEVLRRLKEDPVLKEIPVVILTTSADEEDIRRAYRNQASSFVTKPVDFDKFVQMIKDLGLYWLTVVKLPEKDRS